MRTTVARRGPIIGLIDEVSRLNGRLATIFAPSSAGIDLGRTERVVLNAVVEADHPPTVPQIGRALAYPRQLVQRAVNALAAEKLLKTSVNPEHKRAPLLTATAAGLALKRRADKRAATIAAELEAALDISSVLAATAALNNIRRQVEAHLRKDQSA